jgi:hypothetical protein
VPDHRPRTVTAHRIPQALLYALTTLLAAFLVAIGAAGSAEAAAPGDDLIKVFVVQDPAQTGGQLATLQSIAAATLGDAARADEIFDLNRGLTQKDGGALSSPGDQLHPGWILRLPKDASGPGVQLAKDTGGQGNASTPPASGSTAPPGTGDEQSTMLTVPLAAVIAGAAGWRNGGRPAAGSTRTSTRCGVPTAPSASSPPRTGSPRGRCTR